MNPVLAVVPDLFFASKLSAVASATGTALSLVPLAQLVERCAAAPPPLVLVDLHAAGDPPSVVRALKADPRTRTVRVVGFYAHIDPALRDAALAAGFDEAMARSAFVRRLPGLISGEDAPRPAHGGSPS